MREHERAVVLETENQQYEKMADNMKRTMVGSSLSLTITRLLEYNFEVSY